MTYMACCTLKSGLQLSLLLLFDHHFLLVGSIMYCLNTAHTSTDTALNICPTYIIKRKRMDWVRYHGQYLEAQINPTASSFLQ